MSAPAMNALSPAPVRIMPRTSVSRWAASKAVRRSSQVRRLNAFSTLGRFKVTYAMAPFLSYKTFSSVNAVTGVLINISPFFTSQSSHRNLDKCAEACYGLADDEGLHLVCAFVRIKRFGVREVTRHVIVNDDPVATQQLSRPRDRFARLRGAERLGNRRLCVGQLAFGFQLHRSSHHALTGNDIAQHLREKFLNELE